MHGHGGTRLNIADLVLAGSGGHVGVKEFSDWGSVLWEVRVVQTALPLLIVVDNVEGLWVEEGGDLLILENGVQEPHFINLWFHTLVTNAGVQGNSACH